MDGVDRHVLDAGDLVALHPLRAGEVLLSGSIGLIVDWTPGEPIVASYTHGFGEVRATLEEDDA